MAKWLKQAISNDACVNLLTRWRPEKTIALMRHGGKDPVRGIKGPRFVLGSDYVFAKQLTVRKHMKRLQGETDHIFDMRSYTGRGFDRRMLSVIIPDAIDPPFFPDAMGDFEDVILEVDEFRIKALHGFFDVCFSLSRRPGQVLRQFVFGKPIPAVTMER